MAFTIDKAFIKSYENTVRHLAQQGESKLRGRIAEKGPTSEEHSFKIVGPQTMGLKSARGTGGRRADSPVNDTVWSNRVAIPTTYDGGDTVEKEDELRMVISPTSEITKAFGMAAKRQFDDVIIDAADADALDEEGAANVFPAGQIVGDGLSEISFDKVTEIGELFQTNDIDPDVPKTAVIGPKQARKLMHDPKATSGDYVNAKQLVSGGYVRNWMGFDWIVSNRLNSKGAGRVSCLFFTAAALGLLVLEDISGDIAKNPSKSFMWQLYYRFTAGAVRVEDKQIVLFDAKNTVTIA